MFKRNHRLCQLLFQDEWRSRNGVIRFFTSFKDYDHLETHLTILRDLLADFKLVEIIALIDDNLEFYSGNQSQFKFLRETPEDHPEWNNVLEVLESAYTFYYADKGIESITKIIVRDPGNFCVDQNGKALEKSFTGQLEAFYTNGNLQKKYSFVDGKVKGECMEYDFNGNKRRLYIYDTAAKRVLIKEWSRDGQLTYEKSDE